MNTPIQCITPVDGTVYVERPAADGRQVDETLDRAVAAQREWAALSVPERVAILTRAVQVFVAGRPALAEELTWQMGRPIAQSPGEITGFEERASHMLAISEAALGVLDVAPKAGFTRFVQRVPLGVVAVLAPWNFPYLTSVNAVWPALAAGNAVVLKHSHQTPLCAERFAAALAEAGLPDGVFSYLHLGRDGAEQLMRDTRINFVAFTGSVAGGHAVVAALAGRFAGCGLELGGKDPAYVRADADLDQAVETTIDGAFFNAGQSCCAIERIYVDRRVFEPFVDRAVALVEAYRLGDPHDPATTLGPMVRTAAADFVRAQTQAAVAAGARALIDPRCFEAHAPGTPYLAPQLLTGVDHSMRVMTEESFGPVVGIMPVADDDEAVRYMNDSPFGLTAALFTRDTDAALALGARLETGTVFMNRCDYLDPALAWTGVKDSGRGVTLSVMGYEALTRPKSFHLRHA